MMFKQAKGWLLGQQGDMVEGAITFPIMALLALALVNLAIAGFSANTAQNAAAYAARVAAVTQDNPAGRGLDAANQVLAHGVGDYSVSIAADNRPGGQVRVEVTWEVPNVFGGLLSYFGGENQRLQGKAVAVQRKEGW
jgi:Flp pilus assembly protein TadG